MSRLKNGVAGAMVAGLLAVSGFQAQAQEVIPDFYSDPGIYPNRGYINQHANEHIDPFSGALQWHFTDIYLPGNGGFDLKVTRSYNSAAVSQDNPYSYDTVMGLGWTMHFGRVLKSKDTYVCLTNNLSVADNPVLELPDGSRQVLAFTGSTAPLALSTQRWRADCAPAGQAGLIVYAPDGTRYDMTKQYNVGTGGRSVNAWYTTKITDRNGNYATINYASANALIPEISSITTNDGRSISFSYADSGQMTRRVTSITAEGQTYNYDYQAVPGVAGVYHLSTVTRPGGTAWNFSYNGLLETTAGSFVMNRATYPEGGSISYGYGYAYFDAQANPSFKSTVVTSKSVSTGGSWSFSYAPGSLSAYDVTTVTSPAGTTTYRHIGPNYSNSGSVWMVGLLMSKTVGSAQTQTETYTWTKQKISSENYFRPGAFTAKVDTGETNAPLLSKKVITRDGATYTTSYSGFDSYGNPTTITEAGPNGGNRTTTLTYYTDATKWIINQPKNETYSGSSLTRTFDGNGNLTNVTQDGVSTSYDYDGQGNVASATLPRGLVKLFGNYLRGIPQSETQPEGISLSRVVSGAGNVTSETNGEGKTRGYGYDGLNRVIRMSTPIGNAVSIVYGAASKTATRGSLTEATVLDGFGRPTSVTLGGIKRTFVYDALGRKTFESYPGASTGTSYQYDILDRVTRVTHTADAKSQSFAYGAGTLSVTDERSKTITQTFRAYGNPDQRVLMSVTAPVAASNITIGRNTKDLVTSVIQGGFTRGYGYNGNYYLTTVTNPETGTTTYGRDAAGNMTTRTVGASGTTIYTYDNQNRLTKATYPGTTPAVTQTYSKTHKLKSVTSTAASHTYLYDNNDNLIKDSLTVDGLTLNTGYGYNANDQLASVTYPQSNRVVTYSPDVLGRPTQVSGYVTAVTYWPSGQIKQINYANGTTSSYGQNARLWPSSFITQKGSTYFNNASYTYDAVGNLSTVSDAADTSYNRTLGYDDINRLTTVNGPWGNGTIAYSGVGNISSQVFGTGSLNYTYDTKNRLASLSGTRVASYTYDAYGDIATGSGNTYTYDGVPNLRCINCTNTVSKVENVYDGLNQRVSVTKGGVKTYEVYGAHGNLLVDYAPSPAGKFTDYIYLGGKRIAQQQSDDGSLTLTASRTPTPLVAGHQYLLVWKTTNATSVSYACTADGTGLVESKTMATTNGFGFAVAEAAWVGYPSTCVWTATGPKGTKTFTETVVTEADTGQPVPLPSKPLPWPKEITTYFHNDVAGTPLLATDVAGDVLWKENYRPYGTKLNTSVVSAGNKVGFAGKPYDNNTGLSYMGARYYDPLIGRFTGIDPVDFREDNLHSFNRYAYANNNPYKFVDPDGKQAVQAYALLRQTLVTLVGGANTTPGYHGGGRGETDPLAGYTGNNGQAGASLPGFSSIEDALQRGFTTAFPITSVVVSLIIEKSASQINQDVRKGSAPSGIKRADIGRVKGEQDHIHLDNGNALNRDGSWKHLKSNQGLTRSQERYMTDAGWKMPE